ncbi:tyrosine-type recombinase/integrase [Caulobacter sp. S45]|uniref:tyrosine-type recombinase/integrase n=1 Tax=Caulobacter sp. S45 TaxID=1641861 RepID=UPI00131D8125|nr:tyrosine-type recombinase/integrase [Caulobacter sp. S45]
MPLVRLKGLNQVRVKRADGGITVYWYAWKGGPRLPGEPGSPEFMAAYNLAVADRKAPRNDNLAGLVTLYKSKPEFTGLSASTKKEWSRWLDRISLHDIGELSLRMLDDSRVRADLMDWRDEYADRPRAADYGVQVLSRVLGFAVERGILSANRAAGIPHLYEGDRADLIWEAAALTAFCDKAPAPISQALRLACLTGLRRGDLVTLRWSQVGDLAIQLATAKSGLRRTATIPLLADARALLKEIGRKDPDETVLLNAHGRAWGANSLSHRIAKFAADVKIERSLHDARGTFATRLRLAGLTEEEIAEVMGWERERVRRILARYVDQDRIVKALVRKVASNEAKSTLARS